MSTKDTTNDTTAAELTSLREHNARLLTELKEARTATKQAEAERDALRVERDTAQGELNAIRLDRPVAAMIESIAVDGAASAVQALIKASGRGFELRDGQVVPIGADGEPATYAPHGGEPKPVPFEREAIIDWLTPYDRVRKQFADKDAETLAYLLRSSCQASGGGAVQSPGVPAHFKREPEPAAKPEPKRFGLA